MKICVIGNSHLASLKLGWEELASDCAGVELTFFGGGSDALKFMEVRDGVLVPTRNKTKKQLWITSGGLEDINPDGFDGVLLHGFVFIDVFSRALDTHGLNGSRETRRAISRACLTRICADSQDKSLLLWVAKLVRAVSDLPIFVSPAPFPSKSCMTNKSGKWNYLASDYGPEIQACYYEGITRACQSIPGILIPQPESTIEDYLFSKPCLSQGSVRLSEGFSSLHRETDYVHMNKEYGKEVIRNAISVVEPIIKQRV